MNYFLNVIIALEFVFIYLKIHSVFFGLSLSVGTLTESPFSLVETM